MPTSNRQLADDIDNLLDYLVGSGLALYRRPLLRTDDHVGWMPNSPGAKFLGTRDHHSLNLYRHWLDGGQFSAILFDGSLLQLSYSFVGRVLTGHRLAYVPCPARVDRGLLLEFPILDVVEDALAAGHGLANLSTAIRFDFDVENSSERHPAAHFTMNTADCRIPCMGPVRVGRFVRFIFNHFYPDDWIAHDYLQALPVRGLGRTLTSDERDHLHLAWPM